MPAKLIIPNDGVCRPRFRLRINAGCSNSLQPEWDALTRIVLICCTLWGLFWFQFVIGVLYNMPALYTLSGGIWPGPAYEFYQDNPEPYPWSLAWIFVAISLLASLIALADAWIFTRHVRGKWRMRFAVCIFVTILCGWSIASLKAESGVIAGLEYQIKQERLSWRRAADWYDNPRERENILRYHREKIEFLEDLLQEMQEKKR